MQELGQAILMAIGVATIIYWLAKLVSWAQQEPFESPVEPGTIRYHCTSCDFEMVVDSSLHQPKGCIACDGPIIGRGCEQLSAAGALRHYRVVPGTERR